MSSQEESDSTFLDRITQSGKKLKNKGLSSAEILQYFSDCRQICHEYFLYMFKNEYIFSTITFLDISTKTLSIPSGDAEKNLYHYNQNIFSSSGLSKIQKKVRVLLNSMNPQTRNRESISLTEEILINPQLQTSVLLGFNETSPPEFFRLKSNETFLEISDLDFSRC